MSTGGKLLIVGAIVLLGGAGIALNRYLDRSDDPAIDVERLERRTLEAVVSATGTIEPQLSVDISSSVMGRVTRLAINEGDRVAGGQFLLQIDPESLQSAVNRNEASLRAAESGVEQARVAVESARVNLELARDTLERQTELWELELISREEYDQARRELELRETEFKARQVEVATARQRIRQERATLESAEYDLEQVTITSPIDGVITRRSIEEGETVVIGTMNNPGTVLMTIADFSILEAHVEVDETDIPSVRLGQTAAITIDALPDTTYPGRVTEIGNSPIQGGELGTNQATNFEVVVTLDGDVPGVRPGFTATADIQTAVRTSVVAVPIQSTTVREVTLDADGRMVRPAPDGDAAAASAAQPDVAERTEETEGVFVVRDERAWFVPLETGIAGDRYFEVISGSTLEPRWRSAPSTSFARWKTATRFASMRLLLLAVEIVRVALGAVWSNKLRSFLTILGNVVAVASIMTLVSLIQGISDEVTNVIVTEMSADSFMIDRMGLVVNEDEMERRRGNPRITRDDQEAVQQFGGRIAAVMAEGRENGEIRYRNVVLERVSIQGVTSEFYRFPTFTAERGRLLTPIEVSRNRNVVLLGWSTADRLFGRGDPLDRTITIQGVHFRVVGVSQEKGTLFGQSQDEFAVIPLGAFQRLFGSRRSLTLIARPSRPEEIQRAMDDATVALRIARHLRPREENNFGMFTAESILDIFEQATTGLFAVLVGIVSLALVVAGIVVMNIMLMAVSERTREIGLRKALGATRAAILWQMLAESVVLSLIGGLVGTAIGVGAALAIDRFAPVPAAVHVWSLLLAISLTAVVGLFFGLYPAARAAALDPIDALGRSG